MGTQLFTDCIALDVDPEKGTLIYTKLIYGGNATAIFTAERKPEIATLRPEMMEPMEQDCHKGNIISLTVDIDESTAGVKLVERFSEETIRLDKADAIVSGGRGVKEYEGLKELEGLVEVLKRHFDKVELGASRPLIDAGWLPTSRQIGLTGEKVSPDLYIAVGISGASQHLSGITRSKKILAINTDPQAPIFNSADYGIVGNYEEIVPAFSRKLSE